MKTTSMTAALLLAAPVLAGSVSLASAREVRMYDSVPSVAELQENLAPHGVHRTRSIEIPSTSVAAAPASPNPQPAAYSPPQPQQKQQPEAVSTPSTPKAAPAAEQPQAKAERRKQSAPVTVGFHIQFAFNSAEIQAESRPFLDQMGKVMQAEPRLAVVVEGHTDAVGGDAYNMALSKRRAEAVKAYLVQTWKVGPDRLAVEGHGKTEPLVADPYDAANRRVQFRPVGASHAS